MPSNVKFANGEVRNAGTVVDPAGKTGLRYGILYTRIKSATFENVKVISPATRGVSGTAGEFTRKAQDGSGIPEPSGTIHLTNIEVQNAPAQGFNLLGGTCHLEELTSKGSGAEGIHVESCKTVNYGKLTAIDASKSNSLRRAFSFGHNRRVNGRELHIEDSKARPTGYKLTAYGTQSGHLGAVRDRVRNGTVRLENHSNLNLGSAPQQQPQNTPQPPPLTPLQRRRQALRLRQLRRLRRQRILLRRRAMAR